MRHLKYEIDSKRQHNMRKYRQCVLVKKLTPIAPQAKEVFQLLQEKLQLSNLLHYVSVAEI
jgi:hypothetical protein